MNERISITTAAPWAESTVDGGGPISHGDVAEEIWQALRRKPPVSVMSRPSGSSCRAGGCGASIPWPC
jgi:hypothetical protein